MKGIQMKDSPKRDESQLAMHNICYLVKAREILCSQLLHGSETPERFYCYMNLEEAFKAAIASESKRLTPKELPQTRQT